MRISMPLRRLIPFGLTVMGLVVMAPIRASEPDPAVMSFKLPSQITWNGNQAILHGDPAKPGFYIILAKWEPNRMSHPHFHQNDRFIYVVSGTWWVGWGTKFDPDSTFPIPAGGFVRHYGKQIHYDGAKSEGCILEIMGEGPAKPTDVDEK
jgi:hypothetical protein